MSDTKRGKLRDAARLLGNSSHAPDHRKPCLIKLGPAAAASTTALNHQEPDRVPYDLGGTILTGIHHRAYRRLRQHLGLPEVEVEIEDPIQQLARVHEDVKKKLQVDVWGVNPSKARGIGALPWSEDGYDKLVDEWGIEWWKPQDGGFYYDMRRHPLADIDTVDGLAKYKFPDPLDPGRYEGMAGARQRVDEPQAGRLRPRPQRARHLRDRPLDARLRELLLRHG